MEVVFHFASVKLPHRAMLLTDSKRFQVSLTFNTNQE